MAKFVKKAHLAATKKAAAAKAEDKEFAGRWPALYEHLTLTVWEDGTPRRVSTVTAFTEGGSWKVLLSDKEAEMSAFVTGSSFYAVLDALEAGVVAGNLDWRSWPWAKGKKRR